MKIIKALWIGAAVLVLFVTIDAFHSERDSGIWDVTTWLMLILSFPAGLVVLLIFSALEVDISIIRKASYLSLTLGWSAYFVLGYLQWFKLLPYLITKLRGLRKKTA